MADREERSSPRATGLAAADEADMFRSLAVRSPDGVIVADSDGIVVWANDVAHEMFGRVPGSLVGSPVVVLVPEDIAEQAFTLRAELPGLAPDTLQLSVGDDWIELSVKRDLQIPEGYVPLRRERSAYEFERRINLPKRIDTDKVTATLRDGLLTVTAPKHASVQPRQIEIKAA